MFNVTVTALVEEFEDPYYPVSVSFEDVQGVIIYHHDRLYGQYLVDDDDTQFKEAISQMRINRKSDWSILTTEVKNIVASAIRP